MKETIEKEVLEELGWKGKPTHGAELRVQKVIKKAINLTYDKLLEKVREKVEYLELSSKPQFTEEGMGSMATNDNRLRVVHKEIKEFGKELSKLREKKHAKKKA